MSRCIVAAESVGGHFLPWGMTQWEHPMKRECGSLKLMRFELILVSVFFNTPTHFVAIEFGDYYRSATRLKKERD